MRVDLRGRGRGVAEDLLHAAQVGAALEQVRGGGVPDRVRARVDAAPRARCGARSAGRAGRRGRRGTGRRRCARWRRRAALPASQRATARIAGRPTGTTRSLRPLPSTRTVRRAWSSPPASSSHSSLTRMAVAYSSSSTAASRMARAAAVRSPAADSRCARSSQSASPVHLVPAQHLRQHPPGLGGAELRPRVGGEPAAAMRVSGEGARRRAAAGQRRPGGARLVLVGQPAPQRGQVERAGVLDAAPRGRTRAGTGYRPS